MDRACVRRLAPTAAAQSRRIPRIEGLQDPRNIGTAALLLGVALLAYLSLFRRSTAPAWRNQLGLATAWLVIPHIPGLHARCSGDTDRPAAMGLIFNVGIAVAERVMYLPSIGFCLLLALVLDHLLAPVAQPEDAAAKQKARATRSTAGKVALIVAIAVLGAYSLRCGLGGTC